MNPEQQRIAIAEACGWKTGYRDPEAWHPLPDFLHDLNAMHDAERVLTYNLTRRFEDHLCDICKRSNDEKEDPAPWRLFFAVVNATASQRAEAFLRTIGTWEESK